MKIQKILSASFLFLITLLFGCGGTELQHGLSEEQANEVLVVLQQNGIEADKMREEGETPTWAISVPGTSAAKAWKVMKDNDLPRAPEKGFTETFNKQSLIPTAIEEKALFLQALCVEIQKTIEAMDGVVKARVHVVLPEQELVPQEDSDANRPKAAVLIKYRMNSNGEIPYKEDSVRSLVANSVQKLDPKDVVVVGNEVAAPAYAAQSTAPVSYAYIGPLKVAPDSLFAFKIIGVSLFAVVALLAGGLMMSAKKSSNLKSEMERLNQARSDRLAKVQAG